MCTHPSSCYVHLEVGGQGVVLFHPFMTPSQQLNDGYSVLHIAERA